MEVKDEDFDKATEVITDPIPVLYQSGYLTIKGYEPLFRTYTLGYPNEEVKIGFIETLIPPISINRHVKVIFMYLFCKRPDER